MDIINLLLFLVAGATLRANRKTKLLEKSLRRKRKSRKERKRDQIRFYQNRFEYLKLYKPFMIDKIKETELILEKFYQKKSNIVQNYI